MTLTAHQITGPQIADVRSRFNDLPGELVPDDQRHRHVNLGPAIPVVNVQIRAAHAGSQHPDEHIIPADRRDWHILNRQPCLRSRFHQSFHALLAPITPALQAKPDTNIQSRPSIFAGPFARVASSALRGPVGDCVSHPRGWRRQSQAAAVTPRAEPTCRLIEAIPAAIPVWTLACPTPRGW